MLLAVRSQCGVQLGLGLSRLGCEGSGESFFVKTRSVDEAVMTIRKSNSLQQAAEFELAAAPAGHSVHAVKRVSDQSDVLPTLHALSGDAGLPLCDIQLMVDIGKQPVIQHRARIADGEAQRGANGKHNVWP